MIIGIGTDVIDIQRIRKIAERHHGFLARTFGPCELEYSQGKGTRFHIWRQDSRRRKQ